MSSFNGINQFGSLTVNGQKINFEKFDENKDGEISVEEYNKVLEELKLDSVEFSNVDKNGDKTISEDEFAIWEQKVEMQNAINEMKSQISSDFSGSKASYLTQVTTELINYINDYANSYTGDVSKMAEDFKETLATKYAEIKNNVLKNDPSTIKSQVLEELFTELHTTTTTDNEGRATTITLPDNVYKALKTAIETEANNFTKSYKGNNYAEDLKAHINEYLNTPDAKKLADAATTFNTKVATLGELDNSDDLTKLKEYAKEFLEAALEKGVTVKLGNTTIKTAAAITTALRKFSDSDELKAAMQDVIDNLSTVSKKEDIISTKFAEAEAAEAKKFTDIKGASYQVNAGEIDYSGIEGYFSGDKIYERGKGWSGSKDKAFAKGQELLNNESLKSQMKAQIETMLAEKGVSFDKVATIFENVYNQSITETLNSDGMITGRGARGLGKKGKAYINIKDCVDTFITTFNTNIAKEMDAYNASDKDFDTIDLDFTQAGKDENGNTITDEATGKDVSELYASGETITTRKRGADYYVTLAEQMVDNMKAQMQAKAKAMCTANNIEFDLTIFTTMFNNAKSIAVNAAVTGITSDGASFGGASAAGSAVCGTAGAVGGTAATAAVVAAAKAGGATGSFGGPAGIAIGTAVGVVVGAVAGLIGSGHHSSSSLNTRTLLDTFSENFKTNYTNWVEAEKAEEKNKKA